MQLIKEDGTGLPNSNSYADANDGDLYHAGHLYVTAWNAATNSAKEVALVMATRLINVTYQFKGVKTLPSQALQWPRQLCPDPDRAHVPASLTVNSLLPYFDARTIPQSIVNATCELARELIKSDSTDAPDGQGLSQFQVAGDLRMIFDKGDRQPIIPRVVQLMLSKVGTYLDRPSITVPLIRA